MANVSEERFKVRNMSNDTSRRKYAVRCCPMRAAALLALVASLGLSSELSAEPQFTRFATWGLSETPDPFTGSYPTIVYVPRGTVVFKTRDAPLKNYVSVQTQYGQWIQIDRALNVAGASQRVLQPIRGLATPPPSNNLIIHAPILCLG